MPINRITRDQIGGWRPASSYLTAVQASPGFDPAKGVSFYAVAKPLTAVAGVTGYFVSIHDAGLNGPCFRMGFPGSNVSLDLREQNAGGPQTIKLLNLAPATKWFQVGCSLSAVGTAGTFNTYCNGANLGSTALTLQTAIPSTPTVRVGHANSGGNSFDGIFHRIYVWNRVLTPAEFESLYWQGDDAMTPSMLVDCIGWYKFNEYTETGITIIDYSGKGNSLTPSSTSRWYQDTPWQPQMFGLPSANAIRLDGVNQALYSSAGQEAALGAILNNRASVSVVGWAKVGTYATNSSAKVILITNPSADEFCEADYATGFNRAVSKSINVDSAQIVNITTKNPPMLPTDRQWHLYCAVADYANGTLTFGLDGVLIAPIAKTYGQQFLTIANARIACGFRPSSNYWQGFLGPQYVFNRAITQDEFRALYLYGTVPESAVVAKYLMTTAGTNQALDSGPNGLHLDLLNYNANQWVSFT